MGMSFLAIGALCATIILAASVREGKLGFHTLESRAGNLPMVKLPYGTWQASKYDPKTDIYTFRNIRFAAPPVGSLRFAKPAPPVPVSEIQTGSYGGACPQSLPKGMAGIATGGAGPSALSGALDKLASSVDIGEMMGGDPSREDCLFLDVYVPGKALKGDKKLPVINWIYGGAYILGSKGGMYNADGLMKAADGNAIFVSGNYRLGALGFMAGSTMEKEGVSNAGIWDQRAVLEWIQKYASLFGGDVNDVSAWGESAGAGSIMHHLTAFGGKEPALFQKAVIESPAYDVLPDRKGSLEKVYKDFESTAGCAGKGLACLRALKFDDIKKAQDKYIATLPEGKFGFGPAVDGTLVRQLPVLELMLGNFQKGVTSLVISHTSDEAALFVKDNIKNETDFQTLLEYNFGKYEAINKAIIAKYPPPAESKGKFATQKARVKEFVEKSVFTCNTRYITEAYKGKSYNVQYARGNGGHGTDIAATFYNPSTSGIGLTSLLGGAAGLKDKNLKTVATGYQSYLTSHARAGDVNKFRAQGSTVEWPLVEWGSQLGNVLNVTDTGFELIKDTKNVADDCDFWRDVYAGLTIAGGYAAPGAVVDSTLVTKGASDASANFRV